MNSNEENRKLIKKVDEEKLNKYENFNDEDIFDENFFENFNKGRYDYEEIRAEVLKEIKEKSKKRNRRIATGLLMITALTTGGYILKDYSKGKINVGYDDDVNAGQDVVAIGNPLGKEFSGSVSKGIVSATSRFIEMDGYQREFIQTDTAINPGNSGGL